MSEPLSVADVLDRAADLIEPEGRWLQKAYASNGNGDVCTDDGMPWPESPECFCMMGAVAWAVGARHPDETLDRSISVALDLRPSEIIAWNDAESRTQAEVVAKLREAANFARRSAEFGNIGADGVQS